MRRTRLLSPLAIGAYLVVAFLYLPLVVAVVFAFNSGSGLSWPPQGFSLRWFDEVFSDPGFSSAFWTSAKAAITVALIAAVVAIAAAIVFTRSRSVGSRVLEPLSKTPVMIPPLLIGVGLLVAMDAFSIRPSMLTVILGQLIFVLPFVIIVIAARLQSFDLELESAARDLGAGPPETMRRITLPIVAPAVLGSALLAFAFAFDETLITNFTVGSDPTLPLYVLSKLRRTVDPSINAVASILLVIPWIALGLAWLTLKRSARTNTAIAAEEENPVGVI